MPRRRLLPRRAPIWGCAMPRDMGRTMRSVPSDLRTAESVNDFSCFPHGPLTGLRVIEMGTLIAGPFCGQLMADFGAEVTKVEPPGKGDRKSTRLNSSH